MHKNEDTIVCNKYVRIITCDWDAEALEDIISKRGFRITEEGKSDTNHDAGMYSIHSPLYGTDYNDEHAFEDRYSCNCGRYSGKNFEDKWCDSCKSYVRFVDIDMTKTGWIILDKDAIIHPLYYKKIKSFIGKTFLDILQYKEPSERDSNIMFHGIGHIEFRERFHEIMDFFLKKNRSNSNKKEMFYFIMSHQSEIFAHAIPVYSSHLRPFVIKADEIKYSDEDKLFKRIFTQSKLLNDRYELERRVDEARNSKSPRKQNSVQYLRRANILYIIQQDLDTLWELSFDMVKKKSGIIRDKVMGGRLDNTARNVIVPSKYLRANEIELGYITFLELYKLEIISILVNMFGLSHAKAWGMWDNAVINFDDQIYKIMEYMVQNRKLYCEINRNPTINYGSQLVMKVVHVSPDMDDHCMVLPECILTMLNADFDGDVLNIMSPKIDSIKDEYFEKLNPLNNIFVSRNDGKYNADAGLFKDQSVGLYTFANI